MYQAAAEMLADAGIVMIHAHTIREANPHLTAETRLDRPTPIIAPVMVCVVETGMPNDVAKKSAMAPDVCALNPPDGRIRVIPIPMVLTIRHPPNKVPSPIAIWQSRTTQNGTSNSPWV